MGTLTIAQAAAATGLSRDTLRYYERDGLLVHEIERSATGHRRYRERDLAWFTLVSRLRATGMPMRDLRRYAELARAGEGTAAARLDLLREHRRRVEAQLAEAAEHLDAIDRKIAMTRCALAA